MVCFVLIFGPLLFVAIDTKFPQHQHQQLSFFFSSVRLRRISNFEHIFYSVFQIPPSSINFISKSQKNCTTSKPSIASIASIAFPTQDRPNAKPPQVRPYSNQNRLQILSLVIVLSSRRKLPVYFLFRLSSSLLLFSLPSSPAYSPRSLAQKQILLQSHLHCPTLLVSPLWRVYRGFSSNWIR